nr:sensor histidine kinase [Rheinheimera maricola]
MSSNVVNAISEDQFGRMWLAGPDGLNIVDGNQIKQLNLDNTAGRLASNYISSMAVDDQSTVWLATEKGLHKVDSRSYTVAAINLPVRPTHLVLPQSANYMAMLADGQIFLLDTASEQLQPIAYFADGVRAIMQHNKHVLVLASSQLFLYQPTETPQTVSIAPSLVKDIRYWSSDGDKLWFFTRSNKLYSCQPEQCQLTEWQLPGQFAHQTVYSLYASDAKVYLLSSAGLLILGDTLQLVLPQLAMTVQDQHRISPRLAVSRQGEVLITDYQGVTVIPASYAGVSAFYPRPFGPIDSPQVTTSVDLGTEPNLLAIATTASLNLYRSTDAGPRLFWQIPYPQLMQPAVLISLPQQLLLSTKRHGILTLDSLDGPLVSAASQFPDLPQNITLVDAISLPQQQLLLLYNNQLKLLQRHGAEYRTLWQHTLPVYGTAKMQLLNDHLIIAAYSKGMLSTRFQADSPPQHWQQHLTENTVINLQQTGPESVLVLTADSGLHSARVEQQGLQLQSLPDQHKLLSKTAVCAAQSTSGFSFIASHNGIAIFDQQQQLQRQLTTADGLLQREFNQYNCGKFGDKLYFAGNQGINLISPEIGLQPSAASLTILSVSTEAGPVAFEYDRFRLVNPDHLSIHYSYAPTPLGAVLQFQYKLLPGHQRWQTHTDTSLHYPKLAPGRYQLQLRVLLADGSSSAVKQLDFHILPPWWQTYWAYLAYISVLLGIIGYIWYNKYLVHRSRLTLKQQQLQHQLAYTQTLEQEVQQRTAQTEQQQRQILDITQQKLHLVTAANHDLKHLAALIQLNAQSMALPTQYQQSAEWQSVLNSSQMLGQLVSDLVELSGLDAGQVRPNLTALDLSALLNQLCQQFQPRLAAKQLQLEQDYPPSIWVTSDKALLSRLLMNLIDNVIQNLSANQWLRLSISQQHSHTVLTLADTGPGLPARIYQQWGEPFQRGTANYQGHGLGLSIVRKITQVLALPTELHSSAKGTQFRFQFNSVELASPGNSKKALILDPDQTAAGHLMQLLQQHGLEVSSAQQLPPTMTDVHWLFVDACLLYPLSAAQRGQLLASYQAATVVLMSINKDDRQLAGTEHYFLLKPLRASRLAWLFA